VPLPRFHRLSQDHRAHIIETARAHLAQHGEAASYNQIIAAAGISKASAYHYFDGKADLVAEVRRTLDAELAQVIGPWKPVRTAEAFWTQLRAESARLRAHFATHPADLRVLAVTRSEDDRALFDPWFSALVLNGVALGLIRDDVDRGLLSDATRALFSVFDERAIAAMHARGERKQGRAKASDAEEDAWELLRALWAPSRRTRGAR
jgi:AcrR family transcriptional regulator